MNRKNDVNAENTGVRVYPLRWYHLPLVLLGFELGTLVARHSVSCILLFVDTGSLHTLFISSAFEGLMYSLIGLGAWAILGILLTRYLFIYTYILSIQYARGQDGQLVARFCQVDVYVAKPSAPTTIDEKNKSPDDLAKVNVTDHDLVQEEEEEEEEEVELPNNILPLRVVHDNGPTSES